MTANNLKATRERMNKNQRWKMSCTRAFILRNNATQIRHLQQRIPLFLQLLYLILKVVDVIHSFMNMIWGWTFSLVVCFKFQLLLNHNQPERKLKKQTVSKTSGFVCPRKMLTLTYSKGRSDLRLLQSFPISCLLCLSVSLCIHFLSSSIASLIFFLIWRHVSMLHQRTIQDLMMLIHG